VVRDVRKGEAWAQHGCEITQADINDVAPLAAAFPGAEGVFVLVPPNFGPAPDSRGATDGRQVEIGARYSASG
jgi:uncharacterized protein YbjT (DUF2867 family)